MIKTIHPTSVVALMAVTIVLLVADASAQLPSVDAASKPAGTPFGIRRAMPRTVGKAELFDRANKVTTFALDKDALLAEDARTLGGPQRVAIVQDVNARTAVDGQWSASDDGGWIWTIELEAPGADAVRLRLHPWPPPTGAELILYNADDPAESVGPIAAAHPTVADVLWTPMVFAERVRVEYSLPEKVDPADPKAQFVIDRLANHYAIERAFGGGQNAAPLACHNDQRCSPQFDLEADGVGAIFRTDDMVGFFCSGGMLNRTTQDFTPLWLTATHCGVTNANAANAIVVWRWESNVCNGGAPNWALLPQTPVETVLSRDEPTDWTLLGLASIGQVPGGTSYLGWDANRADDDINVTGIHHPRGSFKRISFGTKTGNGGTRPDFDNLPACRGGSAYRVVWNSGLTQPGSSGSPLFDNNDRVIGTLSCGSTPTCFGTNTSSYGRLDQAYSDIERWLDPVDPVFVDRNTVAFERGTNAAPFVNVTRGVYAVLANSTLNVRAGSYADRLIVDKAMTIRAINGAVVVGQ